MLPEVGHAAVGGAVMVGSRQAQLLLAVMESPALQALEGSLALPLENCINS